MNISKEIGGTGEIGKTELLPAEFADVVLGLGKKFAALLGARVGKLKENSAFAPIAPILMLCPQKTCGANASRAPDRAELTFI
jgi:hypothetical protein